MKKIRKVVTEQEYDVCDLCGEEITACNGNTLMVGEGDSAKLFVVHMLDANGCVARLIAEAIEGPKATKKRS